MKQIALIFLFLLLLPFQAIAEEITFNGWSKGNGIICQNKITTEELMAMPSWNAENGALPLSQAKALEIAKAYINESHPDFKNSKIGEIKLNQFLIPRYYQDRWCYIIIFYKNIPATTNCPEILNVVVMLDGSINMPIETKIY